MFSRSHNLLTAFRHSGLTVGIRAVLGFSAFLLIAQDAESNELAIYGIVGFFFAVIYGSSQSLGAQPILDLPRIRSSDVASARVLVLAVAIIMSLAVVLSAPLLKYIYPQIPGLHESTVMLLLLGPASTLGLVDFALKQRLMQFGFIARTQTIAVFFSSIIAVTIAHNGYIVLGLLSIQGLAGPIFSILCLLQKRRLAFARVKLRSIRQIVSIGRHLVLAANLSAIVIHGPVVLLGLFLPVSQLSLFVVCTRVIQLISSQLGSIALLVLLPLVRRSAHHRERLHKTLLTITYFSNGLVVAPLIGMFAAPQATLSFLNAPTDTFSVSVLLLLLGKQILDTAGNTVFSTFRAIGRPDASWKWNLLYCAIWLLLTGFVWTFSLDLLGAAWILLFTGTFSFGAVIWLCRTLGLSVVAYFRAVGPVFLFSIVSLALVDPVEAIFKSSGQQPFWAEIFKALSLVCLFLTLLVFHFIFFQKRDENKL